jgi:hypothetical protein
MSKRASRGVLDPLELPFTEAELLDAASRVWPAPQAKLLTTALAQDVPRYVRYRARRWAHWRRHGQARREPLNGLVLPEEVLAALTTISRSAAARVARLKRVYWKSLRSAFLHSERLAAARRAGLLPTQRQVLAELRKAGVSMDDPNLKRGLVIRMKGLPRATDAMVAAAEAKVRKQVRKWEGLCLRVRRQAERLGRMARPNKRLKLAGARQ